MPHTDSVFFIPALQEFLRVCAQSGRGPLRNVLLLAALLLITGELRSAVPGGGTG